MLIQSQLSCNLPLLLICPDYAICACIIKALLWRTYALDRRGITGENEGKLRK
jgi:hypothetical protein